MPELEWRDPPKPLPAPYLAVMAQLKERPGQWAKIATFQGVFGSVFAWWKPIYNSDEFETKVVIRDRGMPYTGYRDVYARYKCDGMDD